MKARLSPKDCLMLSAYLDEQLTQKQRSNLEERLRASTQLQQALDELHATRSMLRHAPRRRTPHNFTLTPEMVGKGIGTVSRLIPALSVTSALAALATLAILAFEYLPNLTTQSVAMIAPASPEAEMLVQVEALSDRLEPSPPVIYWGGPPPASEYYLADGLGGGCDNCGAVPTYDSFGLPAPADGITIEVESLPQAAAEPEIAAKEPATQPIAVPEIEAEEFQATPPSVTRAEPSEVPPRSDTLVPEESTAESEKQPDQEPKSAPNPILGLSTGQVARISTPLPDHEPFQAYQAEKELGIIPYITAFIAIISGIAAWYIRKRSTA